MPLVTGQLLTILSHFDFIARLGRHPLLGYRAGLCFGFLAPHPRGWAAPRGKADLPLPNVELMCLDSAISITDRSRFVSSGQISGLGCFQKRPNGQAQTVLFVKFPPPAPSTHAGSPKGSGRGFLARPWPGAWGIALADLKGGSRGRSGTRQELSRPGNAGLKG